MANELKHGSVGTELTQAEWEAVGAHVFASQAAGDIMYASSTSQLSRLGKGADNTVLHLASGVPAWSATLAGLTLTTPTISATGFANANHAHAASNSGGTVAASALSGTSLASGVVTTSATTVGVLNSGSINTGFGTINNGSSTITTTGAITGGSLVADNVTINGNTISTDGDLLIALAGSSPTPDTDRLHIWEGSAGSVDSNGVTQLTIEHSDNAGIQFLTPADKVAYIIFGDAAANNTGLISYTHANDTMGFKAVSTLMELSVSGGVDLQSNTAGLVNVGASGSDWTSVHLISAVKIIGSAGVRIGADSGNNEIDDATQGSASTTLYIGNASITVSSDMRLKHNIQPYHQDAVMLLQGLPVVEFDMDTHRPFGDVEHYVGVTAQALYKVAPWAVNTQGGRDCAECLAGTPCSHLPWAVNYELLSGVFIRGFQQVDNRICAMDSQYDELSRRLEAIGA